MNIADIIKSQILSATVDANRKIGVEIESFYYKGGSLLRIPVNNTNEYSAIDLLDDITKEAAKNKEKYRSKTLKNIKTERKSQV